MRSNAIIRIILFSLLIIVLLGVLLAGVLGGFLFNYSFVNTSGTVSSSGQADPAVIKDIEIEWVAGDITIVPEDTDVITFTETGSFEDDDTMVWKVSGDTLTIQYSNGERINFSFGIDFSSKTTKHLKISVPKDWVCDELSIACASADLEISNFTANSVSFDGASGKGTFTDCNINELSLDTVSGDIRYSGTLMELESNSVSARCDLVLTNHPKSLSMDGVSGDLDVTLPADCGFTAEMDSISGNISSDFATTSSNGAMVFGDGSCKIEADTTSGSINIRKAA